MAIKNIRLVNFKNIKNSEIEFKSNISAIYGQNGSGKTAIIESVKILQMFYSEEREYTSRIKYIDDRIRGSENKMQLEFTFENDAFEYLIKLEFLRKDDELEVKESILRKQGGKEGKRKKYRNVFSFSNSTSIYPEVLLDGKQFEVEHFNTSEDSTKVFKKMVNSNANLLSSFIPFSALDSIENSAIMETSKFISTVVNTMSILDLVDMGMFNINLGVPLAFHVVNDESVSHGKVPYFSFDNTNYYRKDHADVIKSVVSQINLLFKEIVPQSTLEIVEVGMRGTGEDREVQLEMYVCRSGEKIPLYKESTGIVKIISMLSVLIDFYNNENAILVIDELDSHIFEILLNELLRVLDKQSKGQLIFTSHNFSVMENLGKDSIILSTMIDGCVQYNYFKGVSNTSNLRDKYIRAMAIDSEDYISAIDINEFKIKNALRISGDDMNA